MPNPSVARLKIEAHMIEVQRPHRTSSKTLIGTTADVKENVMILNNGMVTVMVLGSSIPDKISIIPTKVVPNIN